MVFGRLFTRSPLDDPREKAWTEVNMQWLSEQFGVEPLRQCEVLLPTPESLPEAVTGSIRKTIPLLERLCRQMHISADNIELKRMGADDPENALGLYISSGSDPIIKLQSSLLDNPAGLVSTLSHELGHQRLLGEKRITTNRPDHEDLTDLVPVFFGLGVFRANDTVHDRAFHVGRWEHFEIAKHGYLPSHILGYALALFAWIRGETKPAWASHLRKDARAVLQTGLKYLQKTNDSMFRPETAGKEQPSLAVDELIGHLKTGTPSRKIAVLWELETRGEQARPAMDAVSHSIHNDSDFVRIVALQTLVAIGAPDHYAEDAVRRHLSNSHPGIRANALSALRIVAARLDEAVSDFAFALNDATPVVVVRAAQMLAACGDLATDSHRAFLDPLHRGIVRQDGDVIRSCLRALILIGADVDTLIAEHFPDPELLEVACDILREQRQDIARGERSSTSRA